MVKGAGRGEQGNTEKGEPAELSNQRPSNRRCSGDVFKGSFLTAGCARPQAKCSCLQGEGCLGVLDGIAIGLCEETSAGLSDFSISSRSRLGFLVVREHSLPSSCTPLTKPLKKKKKKTNEVWIPTWENNQHPFLPEL